MELVHKTSKAWICFKATKILPVPKATKIINTITEISYDSTFAYPLVIASGRNCVIKDVDGNAFHGRTLGALSFTFSKPMQKANFPELPVKKIKYCIHDNDLEIDSNENH